MTEPPPAAETGRRRCFHFQLRDLFTLTLITAALLAWWLDHARMQRQMELLELRVARTQQGTDTVDLVQEAVPVVTAEGLIAIVVGSRDWYALQDVLKPYRDAPHRGEAIPQLLRLVLHDDADIRVRALSCLAQIKERGDVVVPVMLPLLDDPVANVQWHAVNVLDEYRVTTPEIVEALSGKMHNDQSKIATYATLVLNRLDPTRDIGPRLTELAQSPLLENRRRAVLHLRHHVAAAEAVKLLKKRFPLETDQQIREHIADALNDLGASPGD